MAAANDISPVVQETITNTTTTTQLKLFRTNYFTPSTGIYVPQNTQVQIANNTVETREQANQYDLHGHVQEVQKVNDIKEVYLWGYNSQYIVAKITNSSYSAVSSAMTQNGITQSQLDQAIFLTPSDFATLLNKLRVTLSPAGARVTTYSYAPGIGMTSETDPNNKTTAYEYDFFGRLFNIRDQDKNVIKKFCYNYAGQPQTCNIVGNAINVQSYTKTCPSHYTGNVLTYTVPANTYFAYALPAANQLAAADQTANGQKSVDNNPSGTCTAWPGMAVSLATGGPNPTRIVTVSFYQGSTMVSTQTFSNANGTIYAPAGTYTSLVVSQVNNVSRTVYLSTWGAKTGITVTFNNVIMPGGYMTIN